MKTKLALSIVIASSLGIISTLIYVMFLGEGTSPFLDGLEMFKYFTIQSNLVVITYFSLYLLNIFNDNELFKRLLGGVVVYITITFVIYLLLLEPILSPTGLNLVGSVLSHYVSPVLVFAFMYKFKGDYKFKREDTKLWIIYPGIYLVFLVIIGTLTNDYFYPFFQVEAIGVIGLLIAIIVIVSLFVFMSFTLVKIVSKKESVK